MRISHKHKLVFLSLPRAASLSIRRLLDNYSDVKSVDKSRVSSEYPFWHHTKASKLKGIFKERGWKWNNYTKFCMTRNPYERVVSAYKMRWNTMYGWSWSGQTYQNIKSFVHDVVFSKPSFGKFVKKCNTEKGFLVSTKNFTKGEEGEIIVDNIMKVENMPHNLTNYLSKFGIQVKKSEIPHKHKSEKGKKTNEWYNEDIKRIVENKFSWEIKKFGYSI